MDEKKRLITADDAVDIISKAFEELQITADIDLGSYLTNEDFSERLNKKLEDYVKSEAFTLKLIDLQNSINKKANTADVPTKKDLEKYATKTELEEKLEDVLSELDIYDIVSTTDKGLVPKLGANNTVLTVVDDEPQWKAPKTYTTFSASEAGLAPKAPSSGLTTKYLRADGTWQTLESTGDGGSGGGVREYDIFSKEEPGLTPRAPEEDDKVLLSSGLWGDPVIDLSNYATKRDIPDVSGFVATSSLNKLIKESKSYEELNNKIPDFPIPIEQGGTGATENTSIIIDLSSNEPGKVFHEIKATEPDPEDPNDPEMIDEEEGEEGSEDPITPPEEPDKNPGVTGVLSVKNGGTGKSEWHASSVPYINANGELTQTNARTSAGILGFNASGAVEVKGVPLSTANGGTGATSFTASKHVVANSSGNLAAWAPGASRYITTNADGNYSSASRTSAGLAGWNADGAIATHAIPLTVANGGTGVTTNAAIGLKSYPVGSVYIAYTSTSPASRFGGTWTQITGKVLRASSNVDTGGADTVTLTTAQMPSHTHKINYDSYNRASGSAPAVAIFTNTNPNGTVTSLSTGSGSSHSNLPAYQNLYVWRRTA